MKTIQIFFFVALATILMAADCSNEDSEFYNDVFVSVPNLVTVAGSDIPEDHAVYVDATIPRLLDVADMANDLDIYHSTYATKLVFSYEVEKLINGNWEYIDIANAQLSTTKGEAETGTFILAKAVIDAAHEKYEFHARLNLPAGNYRLSFGYNSNVNNIVELRSESVNNNLFLNLNSANTTDLDNNGYFNFTVN